MEAQSSVLSQLRSGEITLKEALELLVNSDRQISLHLIDRDVVKRFTESVRRFLRQDTFLPPVVPLLLWRNCYYLGSPIGLSELEILDLKIILRTDVEIVPIGEKSYRNWFRCFEVKEILESLAPVYVSLLNEVESHQDMTEAAEASLTFANNQTERIKSLVTQAVSLRASDIHLEPTLSGLVVRFRIDGILRDITSFSAEIGRRVVVAIKVMSDMNIAETRRPQDGRISNVYSVGLQELDVSIRVSTLPCVVPKTNTPSEKVVMRLLRQKNSFTAIEDLGFSELAAQTYKKWIRQPQGIIIFTGPTGSGKTSTLYTTLQTIATREKNISTIEDPVEYSISGVTQTQVLEAAGMTFGAGLRSILRQDPDVVMVGEIRDADTAITAVRAALTGHLVLTTLHSNDALGAIPRLKNLGVDPGLISDALLGIVSQRLIRRICPYCQSSYHPTHFQQQVFDATEEEMREWNWQKGQGCVKCFNSGYLGREGIFELLDVDEYVRSAIQRYDLEELRQYIIDFDELSFRRAAMEKVKNGLTDVEEILRVLPESSIGTQKRSQKRKADVEINADFIGLKAEEQSFNADFVSMSSQEANATTVPQPDSTIADQVDPWADLDYNSIPEEILESDDPLPENEEKPIDSPTYMNDLGFNLPNESVEEAKPIDSPTYMNDLGFNLPDDSIEEERPIESPTYMNDLGFNLPDDSIEEEKPIDSPTYIDDHPSSYVADTDRVNLKKPDQSQKTEQEDKPEIAKSFPIPASYIDDFNPYILEESTVLVHSSNAKLKQEIETITNPDNPIFSNYEQHNPGFFVDYEDSQIQEIFNELIESNPEESIENITLDFNILLEDIVYKIRTRYDKATRTRMKKLLIAVSTGNWPQQSQELNRTTFTYLIEKILQLYPKKSTLEACLRVIVRNLNKADIYENIVELLLERFQEIYYLQEWHQLLTDAQPQPELGQG